MKLLEFDFFFLTTFCAFHNWQTQFHFFCHFLYPKTPLFNPTMIISIKKPAEAQRGSKKHDQNKSLKVSTLNLHHINLGDCRRHTTTHFCVYIHFFQLLFHSLASERFQKAATVKLFIMLRSMDSPEKKT